MAKRYWFRQLNEIDALNAAYCQMLTSMYKLEEFFPDATYLIEVFTNYRSKKLIELTLFWCFVVSFMHWSKETKLFDAEKMDYTNVKLYGILRGDSVSHKSGYIKTIRQAFDFVERYFREMFIDNDNKFVSTCIESISSAKLLVELETSSKFISSDEDRPLADFSFFEPNSPKAKESHPTLISAFNGVYNIQRATMTYAKNIRDRSLSILLPTTGDRWPLLLEYFHDSFQTNGLYERILYWTIGKENFVQETTVLNNTLPSIEHLFITRLQIGFRIYEFGEEASQFLKPILADMRANRTPPEISTVVPPNKRAEACQRRGADLIERLAVVFQNIFDTLKILKSIQPIDFQRIKRSTLNEIKSKVNNCFYPSRNNGTMDDGMHSYPDDIDLKELDEVQISSIKKSPSSSLKISLSAAKSAVQFFDKLLFPQSLRLFNCEQIDENKTILNELKIIQYNMNCFSMSDITYHSLFHNCSRQNINVKQLLSNLETKSLLKCGKYIKVGTRSVESWIKILPDPRNEQEFQDFKQNLISSYQISMSKYLNWYEKNSDHGKSIMSEAGEHLINLQRQWIPYLRGKLESFVDEKIHSRTVNHPPTTAMLAVDQLTFDNCMTDFPSYNSTVSSTTASVEHEILDTRQEINDISAQQNHVLCFPLAELDDERVIMSNDTVKSQHASCIEYGIDLLSDVTERLVNSTANTNDEILPDVTANVDTATNSACLLLDNDTTERTQESDKPLNFNQEKTTLIPDNMKSLCKKILLTDSVVLSSSKLNKICKTSMVDVHKACELLVGHGLISIEAELLANKVSYHESYLKLLPTCKTSRLDFSLTLAKFGIVNIETYFDTLKKIDTKNSTYLTRRAVDLLRDKPYDHLQIIIDENLIMAPVAERQRRQASQATEENDLFNKENLINDDPDRAITSNQVSSEYQDVVNTEKRSRQLTSQGRYYEEQRSKLKK